MDPAQDDNMNEETQIRLTRKMFIGGFFFLPWLWFVNYLFFREHMNKPTTHPSVKFCNYFDQFLIFSIDARASLVLFFVVSAVLVIWYVVFVTQREKWDAVADQISAVIPNGPNF